jgi:hypothetical protein
LVAAAVALASTAAQAEWRKAETPHYVIYSEDSADKLRTYAARLEILDKTQRVLTHKKEALPTVKPIVYVLRNSDAVQASMAFPSEGVAGYYESTTRGPFLVTSVEKGEDDFTPQLVAFHELTHYFMFENFPAAYPTWFTEGFAEFVGPSRIIEPDKAEVGRLSMTRLQTMAAFEWMPVKDLVAAHAYSDVKNIYMLYAEGWLLTHYLVLGGKRDGQLAKYLAAINHGQSFADAAKEAFGDLKKLDNELQDYARRRTLPTRIFQFRVPLTTEVAIGTVSPARAALMLHDIKLMAGIKADAAGDFAAQVRKIAARFPTDPFALRLRCEADLLAGDRADAAAAARQWLAAAPTDPLATTFAATIEMADLAAAGSQDARAWDAARARIAAAARAAPNEPLILRAYYDSYLRQKKLPPADAQNMLFRALDLNPNDHEIRYELARDFEARGMLEDAIDMIRISAFSSSEKEPANDKERQKLEKLRQKYRLAGEERRETAREMLVRLQAKAKAAGVAVKNADEGS